MIPMMTRDFLSLALRILTVVFCLSSAFFENAHARVTLKNGNFYRGYTDIGYGMGAEPKIERIYNSRTLFRGMFGPGWGNEYEVRLNVSADGSVLIQEYGGGSDNRFTPKTMDLKEIDRAVEQITSQQRFNSKKGADDFRQKLRENATFRNLKWQELVDQGKLKPRDLPVGTRLVSNKFAPQSVVRVSDGYQREYDTGKVEKFDETGRLLRVSDKNGNFINFTYSKDGRLEKLVDNMNRKMFFTFNNKGLLERVQGEDGKEASYKYNSSGELIESKDAEGTVYGYKYSTDGLSNLTQVVYSDKSTLDVSYYGKEKFQAVKSFKDRDGTLNEYDYVVDPSDAGHLTVTVLVKDSESKVASNQKVEYFFKTKPDGEEWTYKLITTDGTGTTETLYNECCGLPLLIKRGDQETAFSYDSKGRMLKKTTAAEIIELQYDQKSSKVSKVVSNSKLDKRFSNWSTFEYDSRGNLVLAKNSNKKMVKLFYDGSGRIKTLVDQDSRQLNFRYDQGSRPIEIIDPKLGTVRVKYKSSGEIDQVDSTAGRNVAVQVTSAFQNLLEIIRPAGVSFSP